MINGTLGLSWRLVVEHLKAGQYDQVAEFLQTAQITDEPMDAVVAADILLAARQICLACSQYQAEIDWHRRAYSAANRREYELKQILYAILDLISERKMSDLHEEQRRLPIWPKSELEKTGSTGPKSEKITRLLQRIQHLLGWSATSQSIEQKRASSFPKSSLVPSTADTQRPILLPPANAEAGPLPPIAPDAQHSRTDLSPVSLVVYCLGPFRIYQNDDLKESCPSRKGQAVFKYLIIHRHRLVPKEILMDLFWPEADPEAARRNLHQAIYALRQSLKISNSKFSHIQFENDAYQLNPSLNLWLDCEEFEQHVQVGRQLETSRTLDQAMAEYGLAEGLYRGDFMGEDLYEDWPQPYRQHLRQTYFSIANRLVQYYLNRDEYAATIALAQRVLVLDNCQEEAHRNLIRCYLAQGQRHLAIRQYQLCKQTLKTEMDLSTSEETEELYNQIVQE